MRPYFEDIERRYVGMTEEELLDLCSDKNQEGFHGIAPYWVSEIYGFGREIRRYGFYPKNLPLILFTDHGGPHVISKFGDSEIKHDAPCVMFHNPVLVKKWREKFAKPCYNLFSPFVFYRRRSKINISEYAKGTIAYPAHTIPELDDISNMEQYILQLKSLPEKYQPVSVSLHYHDINKGLHKIFFKHGIPVYTAGSPFDYRFIERFYSLLRRFRYTTSNYIGSYVFYSVEMNIPFFLYGIQPEYRINTNSNLAKEALNGVNTKDDMTDLLAKTFGAVTDRVTLEQKKFVESTLGLYDGVSRFKMARILYSNYFRFYCERVMMRKLRLYRVGVLNKLTNFKSRFVKVK